MKINNLIKALDKVYLYNFNMIITEQLISEFKGIKYVCMQGSSNRSLEFALKLAKEFLRIDAKYFAPVNLIPTSKFKGYRIGNILSISHGMGSASILTMLHDLSVLMYYAGNHDCEYIRLGTSGGINIEPGSVVITDQAFMADLVAGYKMSPLGKDIIYPTNMNSDLNLRILKAQPKNLGFDILEGNSIAADDFYLSQCRFDGAINPSYDELHQKKYFEKIKELNILNFEMESAALASFCNRAEIPATMVAVTLLNRIHGDQISSSYNVLEKFSLRPQEIIVNYLKTCN